MEYEVVVPLAGFEDEKTFVYEKIDNFFASLKSESSGIELRMMNCDTLKNIDFDLPDWFIEQMDIKDVNDISVYFIFVLQSPATNSVVNLFAPVILNNTNHKIGQIQLKLDEVKLETLENILCG